MPTLLEHLQYFTTQRQSQASAQQHPPPPPPLSHFKISRNTSFERCALALLAWHQDRGSCLYSKCSRSMALPTVALVK